MHAKTATPAHRVVVLARDGLSMFEFAAACSVFSGRPAATDGGGYELEVCAPAGRREVTTDSGLRLGGLRSIRRVLSADTVLVPPAYPMDEGTSELHAVLRRAHRGGARIVSLCTGAFVLAAAGLLDGRRATTHWGECAELADRHPEVDVDPDVLYIDDGDVLTAAGSAASIDLCLHLVALDFGASAAGEIARDLVVPPHRDGGQAQYIRTPIPDLDSDHLFAETLVWLRANAAEPVSVAELARRSGMSARTFARRFLETTGSTPYQWLLRERVRLAQGLLESGTESIDAIAAASGFGTATNLRKHFARTVATSPTAYRRTFHGSPRPGRGEGRAS